MTGPTPADIRRAEAFITVEYDENETICRAWLKQHRPSLVRQAAVAEMQKRQHQELVSARAARETLSTNPPVGRFAKQALEHIAGPDLSKVQANQRRTGIREMVL